MAPQKGFIPHNKGKKMSLEQREKLSLAKKGKYIGENNPYFGKKHSNETKKKISDSNKKFYSTGKVSGFAARWKENPSFLSGENNHKYKKDRSLLAKKQERNDGAYKEWRKEVWERDSFHCRIDNKECDGRIEAHHILGWSDHPELRYKVNNGITLCHAHHPRKRAEEKRLIPTFLELVTVSK